MNHTHEWTYRAESIPSEAWVCAECDATSDTCGTCSGPSGSSLLICDRCLRRERRVLDDVERYLDQWDGRDAVRKKSSAAFNLVPVHGDGGSRRGPDDVRGPLYGWAGRWAEIVGPSNESAEDFLKGHLMWAAHNPETSGWEDYRRSARRVRAAARSLVGLAPERLVERCIYCDGTVVQDRSDSECRAFDDGLQDEARCLGCGVTWESRDRFQIAVRHHIWQLPETAPEAWVTLDQAKRIFPEVPAETWRTWRHRGQLVMTEGRYRLGDVGALATRRTVEVKRTTRV